MLVPTHGPDGILPTPGQMREIADDCLALATSVETWASRPYTDVADLTHSLAITVVADDARKLEASLRAAAHLVEAD